MAKAKAKSKGKRGKQAKLSKGKKKRGAKKKVTAKRKGAKKRKAAPRPPVSRAESAPAPASFTEIAAEEITPSVPETPEEPVMGSAESTGTGDSGFTSTDDDSNNMSM